MEDLINLALQQGFDQAEWLNPQTIVLREEIRDMCEVNKCGHYNSSWSCPPACGSLEELSETIARYHKGVIVQTTAKLEDDFDLEAMQEGENRHKVNFEKFINSLRTEKDVLALGAGTCKICDNCTYPDEPCRFPARKVYSLEAAGIWVSELCEKNNIKYYYGPQTVTYTSCVLYN